MHRYKAASWHANCCDFALDAVFRDFGVVHHSGTPNALPGRWVLVGEMYGYDVACQLEREVMS